MAAFQKDPYGTAVPGGESLAQFGSFGVHQLLPPAAGWARDCSVRT